MRGEGLGTRSHAAPPITHVWPDVAIGLSPFRSVSASKPSERAASEKLSRRKAPRGGPAHADEGDTPVGLGRVTEPQDPPKVVTRQPNEILGLACPTCKSSTMPEVLLQCVSVLLSSLRKWRHG